MGAGLVKAAYEQWPSLPDHAMRALVYMAVTAKDNDETPTYWGGRDALASAIGHSVVDLGDESTGSGDAADAAYRAVRRAVESLTVAKAISRANRPAPGRNAAYALNLSMEQGTPSDPRPSTTEDAPRPPLRQPKRQIIDGTGDANGRNGGRPVVTTGDAPRPPEEELGVLGENFLGRTELTGVHHPADEQTDEFPGIRDDTATAPAPPLRVVASNPSPPVVTARSRQPALWPSAVPDIKEDEVTADEARQLARDALKGHSRRPITRAGRERERLAQLGAVVPAPLIGTDAAKIPQRKGFGFCWPCHDEGRTTLASDPVNGSTCDRHTAASVAS